MVVDSDTSCGNVQCLSSLVMFLFIHIIIIEITIVDPSWLCKDIFILMYIINRLMLYREELQATNHIQFISAPEKLAVILTGITTMSAKELACNVSFRFVPM